MDVVDPLELTRALIRCASVTPADGGALGVLQGALEGLGFTCRRMVFSEPGTDSIDNLYARIGAGGPHFCFAGHTDVVPAGDAAQWTSGPFDADVRDGRLWGRGAADMKGAIACFAAAAGAFLGGKGDGFAGSISLLITGDEESVAVNGTAKMLQALAQEGETWDACLVGEPTNPEALGDVIKIGRRGSLTATITITGTQGHSAYPERADNPIPRLIQVLAAIINEPLDAGTDHFQPSTVALTSVDVGNPAANVTPAQARANLNIRFSDLHTGAALRRWLDEKCRLQGGAYGLQVMISGEAFLTPPGPLSDLVAGAVKAETGRTPALNTVGGTSDARFIKDYCPVCEFGIVGASMHKVDENVAIADLEALSRIYRRVLEGFFEPPV